MKLTKTFDLAIDPKNKIVLNFLTLS